MSKFKTTLDNLTPGTFFIPEGGSKEWIYQVLSTGKVAQLNSGMVRSFDGKKVVTPLGMKCTPYTCESHASAVERGLLVEDDKCQSKGDNSGD